jgi:hypothetical protein
VTVDVLWAGTVRAADASQAAYFRVALAEERLTATADLAGARERLDALAEGNQVLGVRAMQEGGLKSANWKIKCAS